MSTTIEKPRKKRGYLTDEKPQLWTIKDVAAALNCSTRHIYRMKDAGHMPKGIKLGNAIRWQRVEIQAWIADGCPKPKAKRR